MADGSIKVEVSTQGAQAELDRLRAENAALKRDLQYARDGLTKGRTRMREDNKRLAAQIERYKPLVQAVKNVLEEGQLYPEDITLLRLAMEQAEAAHG